MEGGAPALKYPGETETLLAGKEAKRERVIRTLMRGCF